MKRKTKRESLRTKRAKVVDKCIRIAWSSLESHLDWTWKPLGNEALNGNHNFQKKTIGEYSDLIRYLTMLY
jgi:hypothetical protein